MELMLARFATQGSRATPCVSSVCVWRVGSRTVGSRDRRLLQLAETQSRALKLRPMLAS